jgi:hypothetical protein
VLPVAGSLAMMGAVGAGEMMQRQQLRQQHHVQGTGSQPATPSAPGGPAWWQ